MQLSEIANQPLMFRRKLFKILGAEVRVLDQQENLAFIVQQKAFKLKEDIRVYGDESQSQEVLFIQARQILDFRAAYDVIDSVTKEKVGALRRKGFSSLIQDQWEILDKDDNPIGNISEDSVLLALIRRFLSNLVPQSYVFKAGEKEVASLKQRFNPIILKSDFQVNDSSSIDSRLALAGAVLLMCIEGRQD